VILVDTSVWVEHLRRGEAVLAQMLESSLVLCHPFVIGELACGHLRNRAETLDALEKLPRAPIASQDEALVFLNRHGLAGRGIGWVDIHLLAGTALAGDAYLWTRDKRLAAVAADFGFGYSEKAR
jgi:predicted nucleic acid-binding protein